MIGVGITFVLVCLQYTSAGPTCLDCTRMPYPRDCDHVAGCGAHEVCYVKQLVSDSGNIYYDSGCLDSKLCVGKRSVLSYKRTDVDDETGDIVTCLSCCNDSFCNIGGCGAPPLPSLGTIERGPVCMSCPAASSPESCDKIDLCGRDQKCFIRPFQSGEDKLYETGCKSTCAGLSVLGANSQSCSGCCDGDYCNRNCQNLLTVPTTHTSTHVPTTHATPFTTRTTSTATSTTTTKSPTRPTSTTTTTTTTSTTRPTTMTTRPTLPPTHPTTTSAQTTYSQVDKAQICSSLGYTYLQDFDHCIRIYNDMKVTWHDASVRCRKDGGHLLIFHNKEEEAYFERITEVATEDWDTKRYWIGASDLNHEGYWTWVDNTRVADRYFYPGEPNNGHTSQSEDCGATAFFNNVFLINDDVCSNAYHFICERQVAGSTLSPTTHAGHCLNTDYIYVPDQNVCFKIYDNLELTMADARTHCNREHGDLLQFRDRQEEQFFLSYGFKDKENNDKRYWLGATKSQTGQFSWLDGRPLNIQDYIFAPGEPNNFEGNEYCMDLTWFAGNSDLHTPDSFAMNDDNCAKKKFFICEENMLH